MVEIIVQLSASWYKSVEAGTNFCSVDSDTGAFWQNKKAGIYHMQGANQVHGQPSAWGFLWHFNPSGGNNIFQFFIKNASDTDDAFWFRVTNSPDAMPAFHRISTTQFSASHKLVGSEILEGSDLDECRLLGLYRCRSSTVAETLINSPTKKAFWMWVESCTGNNVWQNQIIVGRDNDIYIRMCTAESKFTPWRVIPTSAINQLSASSHYQMLNLQPNTIVNGSDLNDAITVGNYRCTSDATASSLTNCPTVHGFTMTVSSAHGAGDYFENQILIDTEANIYIRFGQGEPKSWRTWRKLSYTSVNQLSANSFTPKTRLAAGTDWDTLTDAGTYIVNRGAAEGQKGYPQGSPNFGLLVVHKLAASGDQYLAQFYLTTDSKFYYRSYSIGSVAKSTWKLISGETVETYRSE